MSIKLGFDGRKLARAIGVSPPTISAWLRGYEVISIWHWRSIFRYLESRGDSEGEMVLKIAKRAAVEEFKSKLGIA